MNSRVWNYNEPKATQEQVAELQSLLDAADAAMDAAVAYARANNMEFNIDGPAYGMGGSFDPTRTTDNYDNESDGWQASSQSC